MPEYVYTSRPNPFVGSIGDVMLRRGDIAAQRAVAVANAQAQGEVGAANAWAGGIRGAADAAAGTIATMTDPKRQTEALALKEQKTAIGEHDTFKKILKDTPPVNENGMQLYDLPALASKATAAGIDPSAYLEHYANVNTGFRNEYQARLATVQAGAQGLMLAPDPTLAKDFLDRLAANNTITSQVHQHLSSLIDADPSPANITRIAQPFAGKLTPVMGKPGETPLNPVTAQPMAPSLPEKPEVVPAGGTLVQPPAPGATATPTVLFTAPAAPTTAGNEAAIRGLYAKRASGQPLTPAEAAQIQGYEDEKSANDAPVTVKTMVNGKPVEKVMKRSEALAQGIFDSQPPASVQVNASVGGALKNMPGWALDASRPAGADGNVLDPTLRMTPNGLFQDAQNFITSGQYPPTGRGNDEAAQLKRAAIDSKVGAIAAAAGMDVPTLRAFYRANSKSLQQLQQSSDSAQAFMATADKNSALLEETLKKLPDTGSPFFNRPLRAFAKEVAGDKNMAPFATYLTSVKNEYAKIISNPNLSGQLTDSARHEAEQLVADNATIPQMLGSLKALRNEGSNRIVSLGEQIQKVASRMNGTQNQTPAAGGPIKVGGFTVTVK